MDNVLIVLVIVSLVVANGLFVAAEFAIVVASRSAIERRAERGSRMAKRVRAILHSTQLQDRYIATAQLGITFASLGLGMYGEHHLATWIAGGLEALGAARWIAAHVVASVISVAVLTYLHIVVGEMIPKSLALQYADRTVLWVTYPMIWTQLVLYPLVVALNAAGNRILRLIGIDRRKASAEHYYTTEELQAIIEESQEGGALQAEAGQILRELFEFGGLTAAQAMVPRVRVSGIPVGASPSEVADIVRASKHTRYPVFDGDLDHIVGMIHIKDLLGELLANRPIRAASARPLPLVPETAVLDVVLSLMRQSHAQMVIVIDEYGGTAGILTLGDLFEEVVGKIDEGAAGDASISTDSAGRLRVRGAVRLEEIGEWLGIELAHEAVDSVSGLILTLLGRPPSVGDVVEHAGLRFEVTAVLRRGVQECVVTRVESSGGAEAPEKEKEDAGSEPR